MTATPTDAADWLPGMKVKCLKGVSDEARGRVSSLGHKVGTAKDVNYPVLGDVYTLRHVNPVDVDKVIILLEELRNSHLTKFIKAGLEPGFDARHFELIPNSARGFSSAEQAGEVGPPPTTFPAAISTGGA